MYVFTLKRMMIDRTIVQKGDTVSVSQTEGRKLLHKGDVLAVKTPDPADAKPSVIKSKLDKSKAVSTKDDPKITNGIDNNDL